jgi:hypothetical protein
MDMVNRLNPGQSLTVNQQLTAPTNPPRLILQDDGNLVLYVWNYPLWSSNTYGQPAAQAVMQGDGNFVIYDYQGRALWSSNTWGRRGAYLELEDNANLMLLQPVGSSNLPIWSTNTPFSFGWPKNIDSGPTQVAHNEFIQVTCQLSNNGRIDGQLSVWTLNALYGFTGGACVFFYDQDDNVLFNTQVYRLGVDGTWVVGLPHNRNQLFHEQMDLATLHNVARMEAICMLTPQPRLIQDLNELLDIGVKAADIYSKIAAGSSGMSAPKKIPVGPGGGATGQTASGAAQPVSVA